MGKGNYTIGKGKPPKSGQIKPGEVRNPLGSRAKGYPSQLPNALKKLTKEEVRDIGEIILMGDLSALKAISSDPNASVLKVWIANCAVKSIMKGDAGTLDVLLNRFVGKVSDKIEVTGEGGAPLGSTKEESKARKKRIDQKIKTLNSLDSGKDIE